MEKEKSKKNHKQNFLNWPNIKLLIGIAILIIFLWTDFLNIFTNNSNLVPDLFMNVWWQFSLATIIMILISYKYLLNSIDGIKNRKISDDLLVTLSTFIAYIFSIVEIFINIEALNSNNWLIDIQNNGSDNLFLLFGPFVEVSVIIYIGRMIELNVTKRTVNDITELNDLFVDEAIILKNGKEIKVATKDLKVNDIIVVYPGEIIAVDGIILKGEASINESSFTGESKLVKKNIDDEVYGGTISNQYLHIKVKNTLENSLISNIHKGILEAKEAKSDYQKISDKVVVYLIPIVFLLGILGFIFWTIFSSWQDGLLVLITVFVVACPCSFALITPLSILVSTSSALKNQIIYNSKTPFENYKPIDLIAFDKTGTLTTGNLIVKNTNLNNESLNLVYSMEHMSKHPIGVSIVNQYKDLFTQKINLNVTTLVGDGLKTIHNDQIFYLGSEKFIRKTFKNFKKEDFIISEDIVIYLFSNEKIIGYLELVDEIRKEAKDVISFFNRNKIKTYMITGDKKAVALKIASQIGILEENVFFEVLPSKKADIIKKLKKQNYKVCFVGDGINDSIALETSDLGISMGSGSSLAMQSSDITIRNDNLNAIPLSFRISSQTFKTIYIGLIIASVYNLILIPLALSGILVPFIGALAMAINDTLAVFVALTLKRFSLIKVKKYKT